MLPEQGPYFYSIKQLVVSNAWKEYEIMSYRGQLKITSDAQ